MLRLVQSGTAVAALTQAVALNTPSVKLSEAVGIYMKLKGQGRPITFQRAAERSCGYVIEVCGDTGTSPHTRRLMRMPSAMT
jgi:broad specificity polyphosphatase/5'/3'-nucleotidase SurE